MPSEHPYLAAFVAAVRSPEVDVDADWRDLADVLWLARSSISAGPEGSPLNADGTQMLQVVVAGEALQERVDADAAAHRSPTRAGDNLAWQYSQGWRLSETTGGEVSEGTGLNVEAPPWLAVPGQEQIGRALRPLMRRRPSLRRRVLDPEATVDQYCDTQVLIPVLRPARERWFDVAVVADASPTMAVWRDTVTALADLLERHGAFRAVKRWTLAERQDGSAVVWSRSGVEHHPRQLFDERGRLLVLVVTDAVGDLWRREAAWSAVRLWGAAGPVALVHLLPDRMWGQTGTGEADIAVRARRPGEPNARLDVRAPWWWDADEPPWGAVPVLSLDETSIAPWARLVAGVPGVAVRAVIGVEPEELPEEFAWQVAKPELLGDAIRSSVSSVAYRLAALLSAVDASVQVARVVMAKLLPEARQVHLAELLAAGVLRATGEGDQCDDAVLHFAAGVRSQLQQTLTTTDVLKVWRAISPVLAASGRRPQFSMLLSEGNVALGGEPDPMARIAADLAQRLGLTGRISDTVPLRVAASTKSQAPTPAPSDSLIGNRIALLIASENYADPELPTLYHPDLQGLGDVLSRPDIGGFTVNALVDATREKISERLAELFGEASNDDTLLVYFHGHALMTTEEVYLAGADTSLANVSFTGLSAGLLGRWMSLTRARAVVIVLDCCVRSEELNPDADRFLVELSPSLKSFATQAGRFVLMVWETGPHAVKGVRAVPTSPFAETVVHGLRSGEADRDRDGFVSVQDLYEYLLERMPKSVKRRPTLTSQGDGRGVYIARAVGRGHTYPLPDLDRPGDGPAESVLGPDHPDTLTSRNNLANAYRSAGRLTDAIRLFEATLADRERVLGPDHPDTLTSRNDLAGAYRSAGRLADAIRLFEATLADRERVLGPDHPDTLTSRSNLAYAYRSAGRLTDAIRLFEATLADRERVLGPDHPDTLTSRNDLAYAYESAGRLADAIRLYEATLADRERVLGPDHPDTLTSRNDLAGGYESAGRLADAIPLYEKVADDMRRVLGPDHPETLTSRNNLAYAYRSAGRLTDAIRMYEATLADRERVLGPDHPDTLTSRNNLASAYRAAGRLTDAIRLYEATLADRERVLGPDHPDTLTSRNNLAYAYESAGRLTDAIPLYERVADDMRRVLGPDHPDTLTSRNNLAYAYRSAGRLTDAIRMYEATLADRERVLGPDHPDTLTSRNNLAYAYESAGRLADAIRLFEATLADRERVLGPDHPSTLISRNNLAGAYRSAGRLTDAIRMYEATLADRERVLGPDHPDTLTSRNDLAYAYESAGRLADAIRLFEATLADRERVLGPDHPDTLTSRSNLADAYRAAGRLADAIRLYEAILADRERVLGPDYPSTLTIRNNLDDLQKERTSRIEEDGY